MMKFSGQFAWVAARCRQKFTGAILLAALAACDQAPSSTPSSAAATPAPAPATPQAAAQPNPLAQTAPARALHFTDVTASSGIDMIITCGELPAKHILEVNGGGLGLIDFDNDGDLDLFVANGATLREPDHGPGCRMYENIGTATDIDPEKTGPEDGPARREVARQLSIVDRRSSIRFRDITAHAGIDIHHWANGVAVGDYDGDGFDDLYLTCYGPNVLLRNDGQGHFVDVTEKAGVGDKRWGTIAAWGDIDGDGDLDLYVANYLEFDVANPPASMKFKNVDVMAGPQGLPSQDDVLYENLGDGAFRDITQIAGCAPSALGYGLNLVILDFDGDGKSDIYVANDSVASYLFHNLGVRDGHARFEEIGMPSGIGASADGGFQACMGVGIADVDGNGRPDKFTTVFSSDTNSLHLNIALGLGVGDQGLGARDPASGPNPQPLTPNRLLFEDRAQQFGLGMVSRPYLGWGCGFYDFDHDGDEDLIMVNGHVYPQATMESMDSEWRQPPLLFERAGRRFAKVSADVAGSWLAEKHLDRNAVFGDLDSDGDIDMIVGELNGPIRVLENDGADRSPGDWLIVELKDDRPGSKNRRALGSRVELTTGNLTQRRWVFSGSAYQSSNAMYAHFAVPQNDGVQPGMLTIVWPDGVQQVVANVGMRKKLVVRRVDAQ